MNTQTLAGIAALIRADPSVDARERTRLLPCFDKAEYPPLNRS